MSLLQEGSFTLASGKHSEFKIECDVLTEEDFSTAAYLLVQQLPIFDQVYWVPTGGERVAEPLYKFSNFDHSDAKILIVDDVWTTGGSVNRYIDDNDFDRDKVICAVLFARGDTPDWVYPLFTMNGV
jgi:hypothetical protein